MTAARLPRAIALVFALGACRAEIPATEVIVTLDTTFGVPCTIDEIHIDAVGDHESVGQDIPLDDPDDPRKRLPGSIGLPPLSDPKNIKVTVTAKRAGEVFATAEDTAPVDREGSVELRFLLDRSCVPGPCRAVGVGGFMGLPPPAPRRGCGNERYAVKSSLFVMRDACTMREEVMGNVLRNTDEDEVPLFTEMPFPFRFYGAAVSQIWVGDNGYIGFDSKPNALNASVGMPRPLGDRGSFPGKGVLAFWDDLRTSASGVCFAVSGTFPDRLLWITWKDACIAVSSMRTCGSPEGGALTFGIALEETTDRVYIGYRSMTAASPNSDRARASQAVIGATNAAPRGCAADLCSSEGTCQDGRPCGYTQFSAVEIVDPLPNVELDPEMSAPK
ncbi:MAG TPA: hypothetical protein VLM79_10285 [Kofleriaceae bacterium]|nr:hypothetical protein [Kofleriaceae bacterium]